MKFRGKKKYYKEEILDPCLHLEERVRKKLIRRYDKPLWYHDVKMINDIIYNEKTHFVELFKEYLIYEDINEFLKRFYNTNEISIKLPKILLFYEKYSKIYANYTVIPESKYMYKNIKRKQKMIDQMHNNNIESDEEDEEGEGEDLPNKIFNSKALESINSFTMSIYSNYSQSLTSKTETSVNNLINKIDKYERNAEKIKNNNNNKNRKSNNNNLNKNKLTNCNTGKPYYNQKNTIIQIGDSINRRVISAIFTPNNRSKIKDKIINKKNSNNKNICTQNIKNKMALKENKNKDNKMIMSTITAISPRILNGRILSSLSSGPSSNKNILNKKNCLSPTISTNNSRRESNIRKIFSNKNQNTHRDYYTSKLFSNKNEFLKSKGIIINSNKKSKSNSKNKDNNSIINNYHIINNIQGGSTQINIYTGNDLINSLHLHANSVFNSSNFQSKTSRSPIHRKNNSNNITYNNNKQKSISKPKKQKFDLNLRKIIHKQIIDSEASSDRNNINKNFFEKLGKYFNQISKNENKINSTSINKFSINESKLIAKIINKHPSFVKMNHKKVSNEKNNKNQYNKNSNINHNINQTNSKIKNRSNSNFNNDKLTLKNLDIHKLLKGNHFTLHSDRANRKKINFK